MMMMMVTIVIIFYYWLDSKDQKTISYNRRLITWVCLSRLFPPNFVESPAVQKVKDQMRNKTKQNKIDINSLLSFKTTRLKTSCMRRNTYIFRYLGDLVIYIENLPFENKHTNNHNFMMRRQHRSKWTIIDITIHCTHYQHSDWPRAPSLFWEFTWFCGQACMITA